MNKVRICVLLFLYFIFLLYGQQELYGNMDAKTIAEGRGWTQEPKGRLLLELWRKEGSS